MRKIFILLFITCFTLCGCATGSKKLAYVKGEEKYTFLKDVSDDKALETTVMIYNARPKVWEDEMARNISFGDYIEALRKRKSKLLKESGVFDLKCDAVDLRKWSDDQILTLYEYLDAHVKNVDVQSIPEATEDENAWRIIYMTARDAVAREGYRREGLRNFWTVFGQVLNVALAVAVSAI